MAKLAVHGAMKFTLKKTQKDSLNMNLVFREEYRIFENGDILRNCTWFAAPRHSTGWKIFARKQTNKMVMRFMAEKIKQGYEQDIA